jgi:ADP-ribosylglycohydrolase
MLGLAAGDAAGGAWELGYSAITEQATVIAYQLIEATELDIARVEHSIRELDGSEIEEPVYRAESMHFRAWLSREGPVKSTPSLDGGARAVPLGVAFRREPAELAGAALELGLLFHSDPAAVATGVVTASAVAASCFGQAGRDLIAGVVESMQLAAQSPAMPTGWSQWGPMVDEVGALWDVVAPLDAEEALATVGSGPAPEPWDLTKAGLLLAAPQADRPHVPVEQAARVGGSALASIVGGIIGARVGIRAWPWAFANDTWFAEIGRRLVRGPREVRDLPIPYAVEQHLISGERDFH